MEFDPEYQETIKKYPLIRTPVDVWEELDEGQKFKTGVHNARLRIGHLNEEVSKIYKDLSLIDDKASLKKTNRRTKKSSHKRCKECRCKPCKCEEEIHCYQINYDKKTKKKKKKKKKKKTQEGGYPFWFDDVPKGMSRDQYKRLEGSKPKNKSMKVWIRENKNNMKKYTKKKSQKGGLLPLCVPCWAGPALAVTGLGSAGYMVSRSSSSSKTVNGKTVSERKEKYEIKKNGKKIKKIFKQLNNRIYLNGSEVKPRPKTMKEATKRLNKRIKECIKSGFKKC
jgi:hypothetical protein